MKTLPEHWLWRDQNKDVGAGAAAIVDIDGVLADASWRQHHLEIPRPDWRSFFDSAGSDPLIESSRALVEALDPTLSVILLTGRPLRIRGETVAWLNEHKIRWDMLIMRDHGNYGKSREFKRETVRLLKNKGWDLHVSYDDDELNCEMFIEEGIPSVYIHSGYYESRSFRFPKDRAEAGE